MKKIITGLLVSAAMCGAFGCSAEAGPDEATASTDEALSSTVRQQLTCQSWDYRYATCDVNTYGGRIVDVRVVRQLSSPQGNCDSGRSFGNGSDYLWVDHGCRADFEVTVRVRSEGRPEIILFEHDAFGGQSLTLNGTTDNFDPIGFNDKVSSIIVRSGVWQLCEHAYFRGTCVEYQPGEYRAVGHALNDRFSSARPLGGPDGPRDCGPSWPSMGTFSCVNGRQRQQICGCNPPNYYDPLYWVNDGGGCYSHETGSSCSF